MVRTVRDVIVTALDNLGERHLKRFRNKLNDWQIKEGYNKIPRGLLENKDSDDTADRILQYYTDSYGIEVTLAVLEAIDENKVAEELREDLEKVPGFTFEAQPMASGTGAASTGPQKHFVVKHQVELIKRTTLVSPILDVLLAEGLLKDEAYNTVRSEKTTQDQMRELYRYVSSWGDSHKDIFYEALKENNGPLIQDLEQS